MGDPAERYRAEAKRCIELAETAPNLRTDRRWRHLADQYIGLAERVDAAMLQSPVPRRWQPQTAQQQQSKGKG